MINKLDATFRFYQDAANLRAHRQQLIASNIANVDTPTSKRATSVSRPRWKIPAVNSRANCNSAQPYRVTRRAGNPRRAITVSQPPYKEAWMAIP